MRGVVVREQDLQVRLAQERKSETESVATFVF
jgi:hypothetical protein